MATDMLSLSGNQWLECTGELPIVITWVRLWGSRVQMVLARSATDLNRTQVSVLGDSLLLTMTVTLSVVLQSRCFGVAPTLVEVSHQLAVWPQPVAPSL